MRYRKLDANGDYSFGAQQADFFVDSPEGVAQAVQTRLGLFTGEWFLDTTDGTPWRTEVLGKYTQDSYDAVIKDRILTTMVINNEQSTINKNDKIVRHIRLDEDYHVSDICDIPTLSYCV